MEHFKKTFVCLHPVFSLLFLVILLAGASLAQAQESAATAVSVRGMVTATNDAGETRRLRRGDAVYEGDLIETATRARIRMSFTDGGTYVLREQTAFEIDEYSFSGQEDGTEQASFSLLQGALEALSGFIGRSNNQNFRLDTPLATIGLRGTEFTITVLPPATPGGLPTVQLSVLGGTVVYQSTISTPGAPPSPVITVPQGNSVEQAGNSSPLQVNSVIVPLLTITVDGEDVNEVIEQLFDAEITGDGNEDGPADRNTRDEEAAENLGESTVPADQIDDLVESLSGVLSEEALSDLAQRLIDNASESGASEEEINEAVRNVRRTVPSVVSPSSTTSSGELQ